MTTRKDPISYDEGLFTEEINSLELPSTAEEFETFLDGVSGTSFLSRLRQHEEIAKRALRRRDLPDQIGPYERDLNGQRGRFMLHEMLADRRGTTEWYAAEILWLIDGIRKAWARGEQAGAVLGYDLGTLLRTAHFRGAFKGEVVQARRTRERQAASGRRTSSLRQHVTPEDVAAWNVAYAAILKRNPSITKNGAAQLIEDKPAGRGFKANTIRLKLR